MARVTLVGYEAIEAGATGQLLEQFPIHSTYGEALPSLARLFIQ